MKLISLCLLQVWYQNRRAKYRKESHKRRRLDQEPKSEDNAKKTQEESQDSSESKKTPMIDLTTTKSISSLPYFSRADKRKRVSTNGKGCPGPYSCKCHGFDNKCHRKWTDSLFAASSSWSIHPSSLLPYNYSHTHDVRHCTCSDCEDSSFRSVK